MNDPDPWAQPPDPAVHRVPAQPALPPPGVVHYGAPARGFPRWAVVALVVPGLVIVLGIMAAVAIPLFLSQREKAQDAMDETARSESQVADGVVDGYGYRYALAPGWVDADGELPGMPTVNVVDTATMLEAADGGAASVLLVEVESANGASINQAEAAWRRNASATLPDGVQFVDGPSSSISGNDARVVMADGLVDALGGTIDLRTLLTVRDDRLYAVTFAFQPGDSADHQAQIDETLATWEWE